MLRSLEDTESVQPSVSTKDCEFTLPRPSVIRITAFQAQDGDALVINDQTWDDLEGGLFLFVELPFHYHADMQYTVCIYIYI